MKFLCFSSMTLINCDWLFFVLLRKIEGFTIKRNIYKFSSEHWGCAQNYWTQIFIFLVSKCRRASYTQRGSHWPEYLFFGGNHQWMDLSEIL